MATRIDASTDYLQRTANLPSVSAFTICLWFYYVAARSDYAYFAGLENAAATATSWAILGFDNANRLEVSVSSGPEANFGANPATGAWHFMALRGNGTNVKGFHRTLAGVWQTATTSTAPSFTPTILTLGNDSYDEWVNCRLAAIKVWDAALSDGEIENEALTFLPQRMANLNLWAPGFAGSGERARDYGPNGRNLSEVGTLTDEDMPPLAWGGWPYVIAPVAGGTTHTAAVSLVGTGHISPVAQAVAQGAASATGAGVVAVAGQTIAQAAAVLSAEGLALASGQVLAQGQTQLRGDGAALAIGQVIAQGAARLDGAGEVTAVGTVVSGAIVEGAALLVGSGVTSPAGQVVAQGAAILTGDGTTVVAGQLIAQGQSVLAGMGLVTAVGQAVVSGAAHLVGVGVVLADGSFVSIGDPYPLTLRPRDNLLTVEDRDNALTLLNRSNVLTMEDRP